jgi:predicted RNA-binding Zn-ribbon protein involved in translation (DUF1610 family)
MKLGFEETQAAYSSGSQNARVWTERWVGDWAYCPSCGNSKIIPFPANSPVADFLCPSCNEEYELKSQKSKFGAKVLEDRLKAIYPNNRHVKQKIRQQLQVLRDLGYLDFVSRGYYRLRSRR